jgi:hypothetical protein
MHRPSPPVPERIDAAAAQHRHPSVYAEPIGYRAGPPIPAAAHRIPIKMGCWVFKEPTLKNGCRSYILQVRPGGSGRSRSQAAGG